MAGEEAQAAATSEQPATSPAQTQEPSIKDLMGQMEQIKQAQSGSDRKVRELTEALTKSQEEAEVLRKEKMSEKEKAQYEIEQQKKELAEQRAAVATRDRELTKARVVSETKLPDSLAHTIAGNTYEEMIAFAKKSLAEYNAIVATEVAKIANQRLIVGSPGAPAAGSRGDGVESLLTAEQIAAITPGALEKELRSLPRDKREQRINQILKSQVALQEIK